MIKPRKSNSNWRANLVLCVIFLTYLVLLGRLYYLQIANGEHYRVWAQGLQSFSHQSAADRGEIFFSGGQPLAINKDFPYAYGSPVNIKDKTAAAETAAQILGLDKSELLDKFGRDSLFVALKDKISDEQAAKISDAKIDGLYVGQKKMRYYPQGSLGSPLIGFVNSDGQGRYGLEEFYDEELSQGNNLVLNIDYNLQYKAESLIAKAVKDLGAQEAEVLVADPNTGAIVALAQTPNCDPNSYSECAKSKIDLFKNNSCQSLFEPGSVFKPITMAAALNEGKLTPQTKYIDSGIIKIGADKIYNYAQRSYGEQTMTEVLEKSINTGAVFAESQIGSEIFTSYIEKFGTFEPTGVDLFETYSANSEFKKGYAINYATASFGQGIQMTSLQLVRAYSALANGGRLVQPSIVKDGRKKTDDSKKRQVISKETSNTIAGMLASVVDNGFSKKAKVMGYTISGKTGTAQQSWSVFGINKRGYADQTIQSFIGWLPSYDPKFLILVKIIAPQANTAEYSALPVFNDLAKEAIYFGQLAPTEEVKKTEPTATPAPLTPSAPANGGTVPAVEPQNGPAIEKKPG